MKNVMNKSMRLCETAMGYAVLCLIGAISLGAEIVGQARWPQKHADGQAA